jgi:hypothetical protein
MNQDVHHIVWFFQRVDEVRLHDVVENRLLHELIDWHAVRWEQTFSKLGNDDSWLVGDGRRRLARGAAPERSSPRSGLMPTIRG